MIIPQYCSQCGLKYRGIAETDWPKHCSFCGHDVWSNPIPVAVCVQPVVNRSHMPYDLGLAIAKRAIEPRLGTWNFLGGHLEQGETFEEAAHREFLEESGISPGYNPKITGSYANGHGHVLVAVEFDAIDIELWRKAKLCPENSEFGLLRKSGSAMPLGFPIHQWIADLWFDRR